jgi:hypothetical protein
VAYGTGRPWRQLGMSEAEYRQRFYTTGRRPVAPPQDPRERAIYEHLTGQRLTGQTLPPQPPNPRKP